MIINGNGNVYEQIVNYYRKFVSLGVLKEGDKLPSCRELAIDIGVNPKTVEKAYGQLISEGIVESIPKKGYFIANNEKDNSFIKEVVMKLKNEGITKKELVEVIEEIYKEDLK